MIMTKVFIRSHLVAMSYYEGHSSGTDFSYHWIWMRHVELPLVEGLV